MLIHLEKIEPSDKLDKKAMRNYFKAKYRDNPLLETKIINPFKNSIFKMVSVYSNLDLEKIMESEKTIKLEKIIGDISFIVTLKPKTRRPNYKEVYEKTVEFIKTEKPKIIKDKPFIELEKLVKKIKSLLSEALEGKEGIDFLLNHSEKKDIPEKLVININGNYSDLVYGNAINYLCAESIHSWNSEKIIKSLETRIKETIGYSNENPPSEEKENFLFIDDEILYIKTVPVSNTKYKDIISSLVNDDENEPGELIKIKMKMKDRIVKCYNPKIVNGKIYISVDRTLKRIKEIYDENTKTTIRQTIQIFPSFW